MLINEVEVDETCPICKEQMTEEELREGGGVCCCKCYWRVMDEYDEEMKNHPLGI